MAGSFVIVSLEIPSSIVGNLSTGAMVIVQEFSNFDNTLSFSYVSTYKEEDKSFSDSGTVDVEIRSDNSLYIHIDMALETKTYKCAYIPGPQLD